MKDFVKGMLLWAFWPGECYLFNVFKRCCFFITYGKKIMVWWCAHDLVIVLKKVSGDYWLLHGTCMVMYVLHTNADLLTSTLFSFM